MDVQQLRYFVQAARQGSFREGARALFVTRAALSKSVAQLEAELGYSLFDRLHEGVRLTDAGRRFVDRAATLVAEFDGLEADMKHEREMRDIVVRFPNSWYEHFAARLDAYASEHADRIRVIVECGSDAESVRSIEEGTAHVVVTHLVLDGTLDEGLPLALSPLYIAMSSQNPLAAKEAVTFEDMETQNVFYYTCGFERVFWVPTFRSERSSFSNDLMHIYARVFRNEGVLPTPLFTTPQFERDIEFRRFDGEGMDIVMLGYISARTEGDSRLKEECLRLRQALAD